MFDPQTARQLTTAAGSFRQLAPFPGDATSLQCCARRSVLNMDGFAAVLSTDGFVFILDRSFSELHLRVVILVLAKRLLAEC